jgi:uncharacterized protein (DUF1800 family)
LRNDDEIRIAHLYRRAGFGLAPDEVKAAAAKGVDACVEELLHPELVDNPLDATLAHLEGELFDLTNIEDAQGWWVYRMIHSARPLEEKMTLFWHGHFATANTKVDNAALMVRQNRLFRKHALGKFGELLLAVSHDPAMLIWLDNSTSTKKHPNENYARESMELFTLGIGRYGEQDVREVARAFTGWKQRDGEFVFDAKDHDEGPETILDETRAWSGDEVIERLAAHPATALRIAKKLVRFFVADEGAPLIEERVASAFLESGGDVRECVATILRSPVFFSEVAMRAKVKSPCELVVGAIRELRSTVPIRAVPGSMNRMGQSLFNPPTVAGWDGGLAWITTATLFERANFANLIATKRGAKDAGWFDPAAWVPKEADGERVIDVFADALLDGRPSEGMRSTLAEFLQGKDKDGKTTEFKATPQSLDDKVRGLVRLILSSPEYQLA